MSFIDDATSATTRGVADPYVPINLSSIGNTFPFQVFEISADVAGFYQISSSNNPVATVMIYYPSFSVSIALYSDVD
jgi:hypothetical protein